MGKIVRITVTILSSLAVTLGLSLVATSPATAASKPKAPSGLTVKFNKSAKLAKANWGAVSGATSYSVSVGKVGYFGPWVPYSTTSTSINIAYADFPYRKVAGAYQFYVSAKNSAGWSPASSKKFKAVSTGGGVKTSSAQKAADKANKCLKAGTVAGISTVAGGGVIAAVTSWIPGANVVTAAGVTVAAASSTSGTFIVCLVM